MYLCAYIHVFKIIYICISWYLPMCLYVYMRVWCFGSGTCPHFRACRFLFVFFLLLAFYFNFHFFFCFISLFYFVLLSSICFMFTECFFAIFICSLDDAFKEKLFGQIKNKSCQCLLEQWRQMRDFYS